MDAFVPYGGLHAAALAVCLPAIAAPALIGRALEPHGEIILPRTLAALGVCYWLAYTGEIGSGSIRAPACRCRCATSTG
jgi:hypothetical protein